MANENEMFFSHLKSWSIIAAAISITLFCIATVFPLFLSIFIKLVPMNIIQALVYSLVTGIFFFVFGLIVSIIRVLRK